MTPRGSAKFSVHPPDVLPAWVAEMDFPLAEPVKSALHAAIDNDDSGYLGPNHRGVIDALVGFMQRRLGWELDPAQTRVVTDVMIGFEELLNILTMPGDGVIVTPPIYPPFFSDIRHVKRTVVEAPVSRRTARSTSPRSSARSPAARGCSSSAIHTTRSAACSPGPRWRRSPTPPRPTTPG